MGFYIGFPEVDDKQVDDDRYLKIYFNTQIIFRKSDRSFKFEDLFGLIGGFVGIFVGLSLMDIIVAFKKSIEVIPPKLRKLTSPNGNKDSSNP